MYKAVFFKCWFGGCFEWRFWACFLRLCFFDNNAWQRFCHINWRTKKKHVTIFTHFLQRSTLLWIRAQEVLLKLAFCFTCVWNSTALQTIILAVVCSVSLRNTKFGYSSLPKNILVCESLKHSSNLYYTGITGSGSAILVFSCVAVMVYTICSRPSM